MDDRTTVFLRENRPGPERPSPARVVPPSPRPPSRWRRIVGGIAGVLAIAALGWWIYERPAPPPPPGRAGNAAPAPVVADTAQTGDVDITLNALGTVTPLATVTVRTQINGQLTEVAFKEGQFVKKGDFLAQIDPRPYQAALEQTEGQLARDQGLLDQARVDLARYERLSKTNAIPKQQYEDQIYIVKQYEGSVKTDQAQVDTQKLNLTYCRIVSPVSGRVGLRQVDAGNYVQTSDPNGIVVVTQLQPISVIFTVPEDKLPEVMKRVRAGAILAVTAYDRTGATELATGKLDTVDNQIDTTTGTVKLRATFDNEQEILFPNQFVNIKLLVNTMHDTDIVPGSAIQRGAPGTFVYVVKPDRTVAVQKVKLGPTNGQQITILSGLRPGESVVIDGSDRLRDGAKVTVSPNRNAGDAAAVPGGQPPAQPHDQQQGQGRGNRRSAP